MIPAERVTQAQNAIDGLTALANATTKAGDTNITDAISSLIAGYGGGGDLPSNVRMQIFEGKSNNWFNSASNSFKFDGINVGEHAYCIGAIVDYDWSRTSNARNSFLFGCGSTFNYDMRILGVGTNGQVSGYYTGNLAPHNVDDGVLVYCNTGVATITGFHYLMILVGDIIDL